MLENEGPPMRLCCFVNASFSVLEKTSVRKEATTKFNQDIHIALNFHSTNIDFKTILGLNIDYKTVQESFWIGGSTQTQTWHAHLAAG